ncbi:MAG: restriction endonuclease subunit S [Saprospiraceae bacterium]|nr:restriction endonuclease subunit S [Saprospiraceae bacterium]
MSKQTKNTKVFYNTEIPSDWKILDMKAICSKITDGTHDTPTPVESGIPFLTALHVKEELIDFENCYYLPEEIHKEIFRRCNPQRDDVLMVNIGAGVATSALVNVDFEFSLKNVALLKPNNEKVLGSYLNYYQVFIKPKLTQTLLNGGAQPFLSLKQIQKLKVNVPPIPEQKTIAQVLSTADAAIHTTDKLIAQKELRKKWLMQQLLTGKKRLKGFGGEWKEKKLIDLFDRVTRKNTEGNTTVVTISAQRGFVRQTDFFNKNIASEITENYFLVERGEFCYNKSYSNGYPWGATKRLNDFDKAVVTTLYICFGVKDEKKTNPEFFEQYFGANHLDKGLTKIAHEGGRAHGLLNVTPSDFFSLKVTVPSIEEQTAIAQVLQAADKEIGLLKAKAEKLREQKKGLMQVLLTGKVRLKINNT